MLTTEERQLIEPLLLQVVAIQTSPRQTLVAYLDARLQGRLGEGEPAILVRRALQLAQDDGFLADPPALVTLLTGLLAGRPEVTIVVERLRVRPPVVQDPFDAVVLRSNLPFLDRHPTRQALRNFIEELRPVRRVVVINGDDSPGKSYTTAFVEHVLADHPGAAHCPVTVLESQGAAVGPLELAKDMVTNITGVSSGAPPQNTNQERWISELVDWVLSAANLSSYCWWFVLDGFNAQETRTDTKQFIVTLANRLGAGIQRDRHRLILLDFDRTVLAVPPGSVSDQVTGPVPHTDVATAVGHILAPCPPTVDRAVITADVLDGLPDPVDDLRELSIRLEAIIETVGALS